MTPDDHTITVEARPEPISIETRCCAVLVIDMQNAFGAEGGMFHRAGIDIGPIQRAVEPTARVLAAARAAGLPVIHLRMLHRPDLADTGGADSPHWIKHRRLGAGPTGAAPDGRAIRGLVEGSWDTEFLPPVAPLVGEPVIPKHRFSGFFETDLDAVLRGGGITHLVVTGCTTSVCVESTVRDAMFRDYHCLLLEDCMAEPIGNEASRSNHEASLLTMQLLFGWISDSRTLIEALAP